jgi:cation diffusion facilitator CzcD-associated flavoprotein CzcO
LKYFRHVAVKYDLYRFIKLSHEVVGATWSDEEGRWNLKIRDIKSGTIFDDWCDFMINGSGILKYEIPITLPLYTCTCWR